MFSAANMSGGLTPNANDVGLIVNRSGAALVKGDCFALNLDFASTSGQAMVGLDPTISADGATGYIFGAAIAVTTENATRVVGVALEDIADNATGRAFLGGPGIVEVEMNGANAGEFLHATDAQTYLTPVTLTEILALTTQRGIVGIALEATTGAQVKKAIFCGHAWKQMCGGDN